VGSANVILGQTPGIRLESLHFHRQTALMLRNTGVQNSKECEFSQNARRSQSGELHSPASHNSITKDLVNMSADSTQYRDRNRRVWNQLAATGSLFARVATELGDATFDIVHQPVSTCYVPSLRAVYDEVARVLRDDGTYISQHKQPTSLQISHRNERQQFVIGVEYYQDGPIPRQVDESYRESGAAEYLHRWEELVGGLCHAGFILEDFTEPLRADETVDVSHYGYRGRYVPPYVRMKARRRCRTPKNGGTSESRLWIPDQRGQNPAANA
jgi:hypothetical protein